MNHLGFILGISGFFISFWALVKYIILIELKVDNNIFKTIYSLSKREKKFIVKEQFVLEARYPNTYKIICFFEKMPWFYLSHDERLLTAGFQGKEFVTYIICFRWSYSRFKLCLTDKLKELQLQLFGIPVEVLTPFNSDLIGNIKNVVLEPKQPKCLWVDIEEEFVDVFVKNTRQKTSFLLYGPPGNGKTSLVKYLSVKYRLPIRLITFNPNWDNQQVMLMFSQIEPGGIVLFEDFDNYFNGRKCIVGKSNNQEEFSGYNKFTFDVILNALDGIYNTYERTAFVMTVNDISKVDVAIKNRPSRFKFIRKFDNPGLDVKKQLLPIQWIDYTNDFNLDQVMRMQEYYELGFSLSESLIKLNKSYDCQLLHDDLWSNTPSSKDLPMEDWDKYD